MLFRSETLWLDGLDSLLRGIAKVGVTLSPPDVGRLREVIHDWLAITPGTNSSIDQAQLRTRAYLISSAHAAGVLDARLFAAGLCALAGEGTSTSTSTSTRPSSTSAESGSTLATLRRTLTVRQKAALYAAYRHIYAAATDDSASQAELQRLRGGAADVINLCAESWYDFEADTKIERRRQTLAAAPGLDDILAVDLGILKTRPHHGSFVKRHRATAGAVLSESLVQQALQRATTILPETLMALVLAGGKGAGHVVNAVLSEPRKKETTTVPDHQNRYHDCSDRATAVREELLDEGVLSPVSSTTAAAAAAAATERLGQTYVAAAARSASVFPPNSPSGGSGRADGSPSITLAHASRAAPTALNTALPPVPNAWRDAARTHVLGLGQEPGESESEEVRVLRGSLRRFDVWFNEVVTDALREGPALAPGSLATLLARVGRLHAMRRDFGLVGVGLDKGLGGAEGVDGQDGIDHDLDLDHLGSTTSSFTSGTSSGITSSSGPTAPVFVGDGGVAPDRTAVMEDLLARFSTPRGDWVRTLTVTGRLDERLDAAVAHRVSAMSAADLDALLGAVAVDLRVTISPTTWNAVRRRVRQLAPVLLVEQCASVGHSLRLMGRLNRDLGWLLCYRAATGPGLDLDRASKKTKARSGVGGDRGDKGGQGAVSLSSSWGSRSPSLEIAALRTLVAEILDSTQRGSGPGHHDGKAEKMEEMDVPRTVRDTVERLYLRLGGDKSVLPKRITTTDAVVDGTLDMDDARSKATKGPAGAKRSSSSSSENSSMHSSLAKVASVRLHPLRSELQSLVTAARLEQYREGVAGRVQESPHGVGLVTKTRDVDLLGARIALLERLPHLLSSGVFTTREIGRRGRALAQAASGTGCLETALRVWDAEGNGIESNVVDVDLARAAREATLGLAAAFPAVVSDAALDLVLTGAGIGGGGEVEASDIDHLDNTLEAVRALRLVQRARESGNLGRGGYADPIKLSRPALLAAERAQLAMMVSSTPSSLSSSSTDTSPTTTTSTTSSTRTTTSGRIARWQPHHAVLDALRFTRTVSDVEYARHLLPDTSANTESDHHTDRILSLATWDGLDLFGFAGDALVGSTHRLPLGMLVDIVALLRVAYLVGDLRELAEWAKVPGAKKHWPAHFLPASHQVVGRVADLAGEDCREPDVTFVSTLTERCRHWVMVEDKSREGPSKKFDFTHVPPAQPPVSWGVAVAVLVAVVKVATAGGWTASVDPNVPKDVAAVVAYRLEKRSRTKPSLVATKAVRAVACDLAEDLVARLGAIRGEGGGSAGRVSGVSASGEETMSLLSSWPGRGLAIDILVAAQQVEVPVPVSTLAKVCTSFMAEEDRESTSAAATESMSENGMNVPGDRKGGKEVLRLRSDKWRWRRARRAMAYILRDIPEGTDPEIDRCKARVVS